MAKGILNNLEDEETLNALKIDEDKNKNPNEVETSDGIYYKSRVDPNLTVQNRLTGLLSSESPYIKLAESQAQEAANKRGLLNSAIAASAGRKAAIETALPIAQQDAGFFQESAGREQEAGLQKGLYETQGEISKEISAQEAEQLRELSAQEAEQTKGLSAQEAEQAKILSAQEAEQAKGLSAQEAGQAITLSTQEAMQRAELSLQEALQSQDLEKIVQAGANYRQSIEVEANKILEAMNLATNEKQAYANSLAAYGENFMLELNNIQRDPNVTAANKTKAILTLQESYRQNLETLASVYGVEITWDDLTTYSEEEGGSQTNTQAPLPENPTDEQLSDFLLKRIRGNKEYENESGA